MKIYIPKTDADFDNASNFMRDIIINDFGYQINNEWHWDILDLKNVYTKPRSTILVTLEKGKVVGTIAGREYDRKYPVFLDRYNSHNTLGIWRHYVDRSRRGMGLGTKLLLELTSFAKKNGYRYLYLHTQKTIPNSVEYWLAKGFKIVWDMNDDYQTVHMIKVIK